jgi:uncharacterized protein (DUF1697 family)
MRCRRAVLAGPADGDPVRPPGRSAGTVGAVTPFVALLRGVNVGGITVKSAPLAEMARGIGLADVRTVQASGNLLFSADDSPEAVKSRIEDALRDTFGYDAWIVLVTAEQLAAVVDAFPWPERDGYQPYVLFVSEPAVVDEIVAAAADIEADDERIEHGDGVVYWECPKGQTLHTPFAKLVGKAHYKATTTNRNLRTLRKLL